MIRILIVLFFVSNILWAQKIDSVKVNRSVQTIVDTTQKTSFLKKIIKTDSANKRSIPRTILIRSLILPGWGQASNKQYWVIPIVYGAAAGGIYAIWWNNGKYKFYKSYLSEIVIDKKTEVYIPINGELRGPFVKTQIEPAVKAYHRQRDLSWIGLAVGWTLQAIQANVSAHLRGFDMTEDISFKIEPSVQPTSFGSAAGVKFRLNF
ncbi:hypothetical protein Emtol_3752 [Emticicia oligotrophica DSM 17448]|uniref:DUF5683 domain-containing protein n=1 Tax=Emticicia oligotrophica (strain DSM 17448 / CIP 109782 / MTCC 6937 / GPTSA100-15) TaxID=929562 RepID=A0ABN4ASS3_EMTOG|nr:MULTISPECIES: DUF5683 domain-containing protein [Emticicia]AFK04878.1 hypothetical protein Emtol_3752 [Emticicia oligotrophica DSM 17448]